MNKKTEYLKGFICNYCICFSCGLCGFIPDKTYNNGVLEIYASQQDQYIKLVLDQINLKRYIWFRTGNDKRYTWVD